MILWNLSTQLTRRKITQRENLLFYAKLNYPRYTSFTLTAYSRLVATRSRTFRQYRWQKRSKRSWELGIRQICSLHLMKHVKNGHLLFKRFCVLYEIQDIIFTYT